MLIHKDVISGIMLIFLCIIGFKSIQKIKFLEPAGSVLYELGPAFFPNLLLIILAISGGILIFTGSYSMIKNKEKLDMSIFNWQKLKIYCNIILFILSLLIYQIFMPILGFLLTTFLFLCIIVTWFYFIFTNPKLTKGHLFHLFVKMIIINVSVTIFIYLAFYFIAKVPLPKGIYGG